MTSCSREQRERGGPLLGSAPRMDALVLVGCRRPWDARVHRSAGFPAGLEGALEAARKASGRAWKLLATPAAPGAPGPAELRFYHRDPEGGTWLSRLTWRGPEALEEDLRAAAPRPAPPLLLVCTHGSRDRCCGALGHPLFRAAREAAPADWEVLECSHLGGHRFAPTLVALPSWRCYGSLELSEVPALLAHLEAGTVLRGRHRGALWLPGPAQVAEGAAWEHLEPPPGVVEVLRLEGADGLYEASLRVRGGAGPEARYRVRFERREVPGHASCSELAEPTPGLLEEFHLLGFAPE